MSYYNILNLGGSGGEKGGKTLCHFLQGVNTLEMERNRRLMNNDPFWTNFKNTLSQFSQQSWQ